MNTTDTVLDQMMGMLRERYGNQLGNYLLPPPSFTGMGGEFTAFESDKGLLTARFPIRKDYLNPYGAVQGGVIAAILDNVLGPLGMLVAPPNMTRRMEITYSYPITIEMDVVTASARLLERKDRQLTFRAEVRDPEGKRMARAKAIHWVLDS